MADITVTNSDFDALATKLEGMSSEFSEQEQATLHALFALAGAGVEAVGSDVEGFAVDAFRPGAFEISVPGSQGILIGLNQAFGAGGGGGSGFVGGSMGKFRLLGGGTFDKQ